MDMDAIAAEVRDSFHTLFYTNRAWQTSWCGVPTPKCPLDLWVMQQIIFEQKPEVIVETGTAFGGSALFYAMVLERLGNNGTVVSIDIAKRDDRPKHDSIIYLTGDSTDRTIFNTVRGICNTHPTMVCLDSDHSYEHVLKELEMYAPLVTPGQFLVVEDTNLNGHPVMSHHGPGPYEAVKEFLTVHPDFAVVSEAEYFGLTFNPGGYLYRGSFLEGRE